MRAAVDKFPVRGVARACAPRGRPTLDHTCTPPHARRGSQLRANMHWRARALAVRTWRDAVAGGVVREVRRGDASHVRAVGPAVDDAERSALVVDVARKVACVQVAAAHAGGRFRPGRSGKRGAGRNCLHTYPPIGGALVDGSLVQRGGGGGWRGKGPTTADSSSS